MACFDERRCALLPVRALSLERVEELRVCFSSMLLLLFALRLCGLIFLLSLGFALSALCVDVLLVIVYFLLLVTWKERFVSVYVWRRSLSPSHWERSFLLVIVEESRKTRLCLVHVVVRDASKVCRGGT